MAKDIFSTFTHSRGSNKRHTTEDKLLNYEAPKEKNKVRSSMEEITVIEEKKRPFSLSQNAKQQRRKTANPRTSLNVSSPRKGSRKSIRNFSKDDFEFENEKPEETPEEKLRKQFPNADNVQNCVDCKMKLKKPTASLAGRLYVTQTSLYFLSKVMNMNKEWTREVILDVDKETRERKDGTLSHYLTISVETKKKSYKQIVLVFKSQELIEQTFKIISRYYIDSAGVKNSALHTCITRGDYHRLQQLLDVNPQKLSLRNKYLKTPLLIACIDGKMDCFQLILKYYREKEILDINDRDSNGDHLLHLVVQEKVKDEIIRELISFPKIEINATNVDQNTPLHYFCKYTNSIKCDELLDEMVKLGAHINAENKTTETPLHRAMQNRNGVCALLVSSLLKHHPNLNITTETNKETPLHYAVRLGRTDLLSMMIKAGSDIMVVNSNGEDALQLAINEREKAKAKNVTLVDQFQEIIKILRNVKRLGDILNDCNLQESMEIFIKDELYMNLRKFVNLSEETLKSKFQVGWGNMTKLRRHMKTLTTELDEEAVQEKLQSEVRKQKTEVNKEEVEAIRTDLKLKGATWEIPSSYIEFSKRLGKGTSGQVFKATLEGKVVAVKILTATDSESEISEFKKELQILMRINSPYVVRFYGATIVPYLSMVMEYCEHGSLFDYLMKMQQEFSWPLAIRFTTHMAEGIKDLHKHAPPIVHRDLKSLNLLVTEDLKCKVCDFGLSRLYVADNATFNKLCGTSAYVAPEIFNDRISTTQSDVYSMGIVIWEVMTTAACKKYSQPFSEYSLSNNAVLLHAAEGKRPTVPLGVPRDFADLYQSCVKHDPNDRPSAEQICKKIKEIQDSFEKDPEYWKNAAKRTSDIPIRTDSKSTTSIQTPITSPKHLPQPQPQPQESKNTPEALLTHNDSNMIPAGHPSLITDPSTPSTEFPGWKAFDSPKSPTDQKNAITATESQQPNAFPGWGTYQPALSPTTSPKSPKNEQPSTFPGWDTPKPVSATSDPKQPTNAFPGWGAVSEPKQQQTQNNTQTQNAFPGWGTTPEPKQTQNAFPGWGATPEPKQPPNAFPGWGATPEPKQQTQNAFPGWGTPTPTSPTKEINSFPGWGNNKEQEKPKDTTDSDTESDSSPQ